MSLLFLPLIWYGLGIPASLFMFYIYRLTKMADNETFFWSLSRYEILLVLLWALLGLIMDVAMIGVIGLMIIALICTGVYEGFVFLGSLKKRDWWKKTVNGKPVAPGKYECQHTDIEGTKHNDPRGYHYEFRCSNCHKSVLN